MNIVNRLTLRQLMLNKKRTLITIIGTIISAAMITAVATLGLSFIDLIQRDNIANNGEWHVVYSDVNKQQYEAIAADKETKTAILRKDLGYAYLNESANNNKPYLFVQELSSVGFESFPAELTEGRLPKKPDEIVISEAIETNAKVDYKIGDTLKLTIGQRMADNPEDGTEPLMQNMSLRFKDDVPAEKLTEDFTKTYTIVGIIKQPAWEYTWAPGYTCISYIGPDTVAPTDKFNVQVIVKHINNKLFNHARQLAEANGIPNYGFNTELLRYYGVVKDDTVRGMLYTLMTIIMVIIVIGSVSLIYNAFAISVSERSRYLGMLSSVGATRRQKRNSVFFEGAVIGAVSIPLGVLSGYAGLGITFICINPLILKTLNVTVGFRLTVFPSALIAAILISIGTILISTYLPARKASNISAIDAIRQSTDIKISRRQVKTSGLTRRIFGIEGELGLKNLKRNKKRYKATVFSLIISMVLFLVVTSFTENLKKSLGVVQDGINFDIQATVYDKDKAEKEDIVKRISSLNDIKALSRVDVLDAGTMISEASAGDNLKKDGNIAPVDGKYPYQVTVNVLDDAALKKYSDKIGADYNSLISTDKPSAIVVDTIKYKDNSSDKYYETNVIKASKGDKLELTVQASEGNNTVALEPVTIAALTGAMPMGIMSSGNYSSFNIIMSKAAFDKITEGSSDVVSNSVTTFVNYLSDDPMQLQENIEAVQSSFGVSKLGIYNVFKYRQSEQQMIFLLSIFTYAFIILITAICIANIFNTVSTSIALRKREFAMLKSVGITPKGFNKMLNYESIFYGVKALIYGLPISFAVMLMIYKVLLRKVNFEFIVPYTSLVIVIISVFIIVGMAMLYSSSKVRKDNIIDALKQEII